MLGHTDKKTVNKRRPLSTNMICFLADLLRDGQVPHASLDQSDKNCARALLDRGYAAWHAEDRTYSITSEGIAALDVKPEET